MEGPTNGSTSPRAVEVERRMEGKNMEVVAGTAGMLCLLSVFALAGYSERQHR